MIEQIANRYQIRALIGQGGMADVYKATDIILNRDVAIKILRSKLSDDPMILVRFQREASAASRLSHPNVVDIYDVGEYEGLQYMVMEYIKGPTLKQLIQRRGALDVEEAVFIMKQLTSAIAHAHENHIIHRDIKPQNILVKNDGTVKITDFGIAIAADNVQLTYNNAVMGSAHYLAPESAQGKEPDERIDIYSLGIVFYELMTGDVPFKGKTAAEIAIKHLREKMPYVRNFNPDIPQSVENIILKATCKDVTQRYQTANAMLNDLNRCLLAQYRNVPRIQFKPKQIPVVKVDDGHVKVVDYEDEKVEEKKPRRSWLTYFLTTVGIVSAVSLLLLLASLTGAFSISDFFGLETMPQVTSLSQQQAISILEEAGFNSENITIQENVSDSVIEGSVISTNVPAGSLVNKNSKIVLTVSKGPSFLVSDYTGRYLSNVQAELEANGVNLNYTIEYRGAANTNPGIILEQKGLTSGTRIDPDAGENITFVVASYPSAIISSDLIGMDVDEAKQYLNDQGFAVSLRQTGYSGNRIVVDTDPAVGSTYVQEGTDSVITLYYD